MQEQGQEWGEPEEWEEEEERRRWVGAEGRGKEWEREPFGDG